MPFSAVLSVSTAIAILSCLISIYSTCHSQQIDQFLHYLKFSAVWSVSPLFDILSLIRVYTICHRRLIRVPGPTLFPILSSMISGYIIGYSQSGFYCIWHSQQSALFSILSSLIRVYTVCHPQQSIQGLHSCHSQQPDQGLHCLLFSAIWSTSTLFPILSSLIRV